MAVALLAGLCAATCLAVALLAAGAAPPAQAIAGAQAWQIREIAVATAPGDQLSPAISGNTVVFNDLGASPGGRVAVRDLADPADSGGYLFAAGVAAGPAVDEGAVAWQDTDSRVCLGTVEGVSETCVTSAAAGSLALSGRIAVTGEAGGGSTISRINFETGRSRKLDSHAQPGMRFDPDIDGDQAVWVKLRGYGSSYYEPLIVSYDVSDDTWSYLTRTGGGATADGESVYQRRSPAVSGGRVLYQQRRNETDADWDIYEAVPDTYGVPVVVSPGDQVNPSFDNGLLVYQDNRNGHADGSGGWVDDWDIYLMDLESGREQLLVGAPGDQVKPVIRGNKVVWEDNRGGDWDVYAAEISPSGGQPAPRLTLARGSVFWESYQAYTARELSVDYRITNSGGEAHSVTVERIVCDPETVEPAGPLPAVAPGLVAGQAMSFRLTYSVPDGVIRFHTRLYANCLDSNGVRIWFPGPPPT